jgi:cell division inhibitor SepF
MGALDKFLDMMKLTGDEGDYYDEDFDEADEVAASKRKADSKEAAEGGEERKKATPKVTPMSPRTARKGVTELGGMEVCVFKPTSFDEDAREISDTLLANRTVVLNIEGLDDFNSQRILDFTSGTAYAISGNLQHISQFVYIVTPSSVQVSGDFQETISNTFNIPINQRF